MIKNLLQYTAAADQVMIGVFETYPNCSDRAVLLFSHILNAQHIWVSRILSETPHYERLQGHPPAKFSDISAQNMAQIEKIMGTLPFQQQVSYANSEGSTFVNTIEEILYHLVNHSTYHRGQLAAEFRQSGIAPPLTDLIIFQRNGKL